MISKRKSKDKNSETQQDKKLNASINEALKSLKKMRRNEIPRNSNQIYKIGSARTTLFLNDFLPQVYLTLVSVLQGVALSALINEFEYGLTSLVTYGYIISSFLIIVAFWHSYLSAIFDGRWPFRFVDTLLFFMAASAETPHPTPPIRRIPLPQEPSQILRTLPTRAQVAAWRRADVVDDPLGGFVSCLCQRSQRRALHRCGRQLVH
jgi:hypothetical protein